MLCPSFDAVEYREKTTIGGFYAQLWPEFLERKMGLKPLICQSFAIEKMVSERD